MRRSALATREQVLPTPQLRLDDPGRGAFRVWSVTSNAPVVWSSAARRSLAQEPGSDGPGRAPSAGQVTAAQRVIDGEVEQGDLEGIAGHRQSGADGPGLPELQGSFLADEPARVPGAGLGGGRKKAPGSILARQGTTRATCSAFAMGQILQHLKQNLGWRGCLVLIGGLSSDQRGRTRISPYHPSIG